MWDNETLHTKENNQVLKKLWILVFKKNAFSPLFYR